MLNTCGVSFWASVVIVIVSAKFTAGLRKLYAAGTANDAMVTVLVPPLALTTPVPVMVAVYGDPAPWPSVAAVIV
jgi:hypothetical protein